MYLVTKVITPPPLSFLIRYFLRIFWRFLHTGILLLLLPDNLLALLLRGFKTGNNLLPVCYLLPVLLPN